jgi:hypothetical protein
MFRVLPPFGGDPRATAEVVNGIMNGKTNNTGSVTLATGGALTTTITDERIGYDSKIILIPASTAAYADSTPYGSFQDTTTQTISSVTTAYPMTFNTVDYSNGVSVVSNSRITVKNYGIYNIQFSGQFANSDTSIHDIDIWIAKNGTVYPLSKGQVSVPNSHGGIDGHVLPAWNYFIELNANDYIELMWQASSTQVSMQAIPVGTSPTRPAAASIIATVQYVAPSSTTNVYVSAKDKGTATLSHFANSTSNKTYDYVIVG